jgi:hypothetical protein
VLRTLVGKLLAAFLFSNLNCYRYPGGRGGGGRVWEPRHEYVPRGGGGFHPQFHQQHHGGHAFNGNGNGTGAGMQHVAKVDGVHHQKIFKPQHHQNNNSLGNNMSKAGEKLKKPVWDSKNLPPFPKDFYNPPAQVLERYLIST